MGAARLDGAHRRPLSDLVERGRSLLAEARRIVVLTGAGVSAESGVPTFRGAAGLWKSHRPEDLATPDAFARNPRLVWEWYAWRRGLIAACTPNAGHLSLARLALKHADTRIVTQNVDGLHHRAADVAATESADDTDASRAYPLELHGAIHRDRCATCGRRTPGGHVDASAVERLPSCAACGGALRPDVVWFGEALDPAVLGRAFDAAREADLCLVVGTSAVVHPAAAVPEATRSAGGAVIEVNPDPTPLTPRADVSIRGKAAELLPDLLRTP